MKMNLHSLTVASILCVGLATAGAADKKVGGPKGGRLLENNSPRAEFFVEKDHTVTITFYDADLKPVSVAGQSVSVVADAKSGKATVEFAKQGDVLVSKGKLPEGDGYDLVVQVRQTPEAKPQDFRFKFEQKICSDCKRAEYACTCD